MTFMFEEVSGTEISIKEEGEPVFTFSYGEDASLSHFHPLYTPNGFVVTTGMNGIEQHHPPGLCFTFGTVRNGSRKLVKRRKVVPSPDEKLSNRTLSNNYAQFIHTVLWVCEEPCLTEVWKVTVYPIQNDVRILDLTLVLGASSNLISFENEIGLGYHAAEMEHRKVANADSKIGESEVNGQESEWAALCGITSDNAVGFAILPHIDNGRTLFQAEDTYQGYLSANTSPFILNANENRELKYRILIYLGDLFTFDVSNYHKKYIDSNNGSFGVNERSQYLVNP